MNRYAVFTVLVLWACSAPQPKVHPDTCPQWTHLGNKDPEGRYILGVGSGYIPQEAEDDARAEIAKFFEVEVARTRLSGEEYEQSGKHYHYSFTSTSAIKTRVNKVLKGVEVLKRTHCEDRYWVLAGLDIHAARHRMSRAVKAGFKQAMALTKRAGHASDPLTAMGYCLKALHVLEEIRADAADLAALGGSPPDLSGLRSQLLDLFEDLRNKTSFYVEGSRPATDYTAHELTSRGFKLEPYQEAARVMITVNYSKRSVNRLPRRYKWVRASVTFKAWDKDSGTVIFTYGPKVFDASGITYEGAYTRADYLLKARVIPEVMDEFFSILWNKESTP